MNTNADDRLLGNLLRHADLTSAVSDSVAESDHADEETLALFASGELTDPERHTLVGHLANCPSCRELASLIISLEDDAVQVSDTSAVPVRPAVLPRYLSLLVAVAALILAAVGLNLFDAGNQPGLAERRAYEQAAQLLVASDFGGAQDVIRLAEQNGISSGRLASLDVQALRRIPDPYALSSAGRLSDFGYGIGGVVAMGPGNETVDLNAAARKLELADGESVEASLNRGHVLLSQGDGAEADAVFEAIINAQPDNALAHLGRGIARYMLEDFVQAADEFRQVLALAPDNIPARINLAMTLEELDELDEAIRLWKELLSEPLPSSEKEQIQRNLSELQQALDQ